MLHFDWKSTSYSVTVIENFSLQDAIFASQGFSVHFAPHKPLKNPWLAKMDGYRITKNVDILDRPFLNLSKLDFFFGLSVNDQARN